MKNMLADHERPIWILKTRGPQPLSALAIELKVTTEGARFQLLKLANEGLVQATFQAKGRGRPQQIWSLTRSGHDRFPDTHAELAVTLLTTMRSTLGEEVLQAVINTDGNNKTSRYTHELREFIDLAPRLDQLAKLRSREGYMAECRREEAGYLLIENHCPICPAAAVCPSFCQSELNTFQAVLGDTVAIERVEHILSGDRRCVYRIG